MTKDDLFADMKAAVDRCLAGFKEEIVKIKVPPPARVVPPPLSGISDMVEASRTAAETLAVWIKEHADNRLPPVPGPEVRDAARNIIKWYNTIPDYGGGWGDLAYQIVVCAQSVLAVPEEAPDDAEPVTEAFAAETGAIHPKFTATFCWDWPTGCQAVAVRWRTGESGLWIVSNGVEIRIASNPTRGRVRRLLKELTPDPEPRKEGPSAAPH